MRSDKSTQDALEAGRSGVCRAQRCQAGDACWWYRPATWRWRSRWRRSGPDDWERHNAAAQLHSTTDEYKKRSGHRRVRSDHLRSVRPATMPRANTVFIGRVPPGPAWRGGEDASAENVAGETATRSEREARRRVARERRAEQKREVVRAPQIIDWDRAHPLLGQCRVGQRAIADSLVLDPPPGGTVLIDSTAGPIAAIAPRDAYQDAVLGFEIVGRTRTARGRSNTNWPRRLSFPTFWLNALEYLGGGTEESQVEPGAAGPAGRAAAGRATCPS